MLELNPQCLSANCPLYMGKAEFLDAWTVPNRLIILLATYISENGCLKNVENGVPVYQYENRQMLDGHMNEVSDINVYKKA